MTDSRYDQLWHSAVSLLPKDKNHEVVEIGWEQHVILDHEKGLVYRYPRTPQAAAKLDDEIGVLEALNEQNWTVAIPQMIKRTQDCAVYRIIEGEVRVESEFAVLTDEQAALLGADLGVFLAQLHGVDQRIVEKKKTRQTISLFDYYKGRIEKNPQSQFYEPALRDLSALEQVVNGSQVVVHGDLHGPNMVLNPQTKRLAGVIDFSEVEIGDPNQEFRKLYMTDERLLSPAMDTYQKNGGATLSGEQILLWAYVNDWANLCYFSGQPDSPTYQRDLLHMQKWGKI